MFLLILERKRERNVDVRNMDWLPPVHTPIGNWIRNLGMCPDQELNRQHFGAQDSTPTNLATWPWQQLFWFVFFSILNSENKHLDHENHNLNF